MDEEVKEWIKQEGYPLEFSTAYRFKAKNFNVDQSYFVNDGNGKTREIDVLATKNIRVGDSILRVLHVVECKWSKDKPWVLFSDEKRFHSSALAAQLISTSLGQALCWAAAGNEEFTNLNIFKQDGFSFSGRQVFSKGNDLFYQAAQSVVSNCINIVSSYEDYEFRIDRPSVAVVAIPVVVIDGILYEAQYDEAESDLAVKKVSHSRLRWNGNEKRKLNTVIDVVTNDHLETFIDERNSELDVICKSLSTTFEQLIKCFNEKTNQYLEIKEGPRGIFGKPLIISQLNEIVASNKAGQSGGR